MTFIMHVCILYGCSSC